jgi:hypothetical protein
MANPPGSTSFREIHVPERSRYGDMLHACIEEGKMADAQYRRKLAMTFHIGHQVVCIDDRFPEEGYWWQVTRNLPRRNSIYTIRRILRGEDYGVPPSVSFHFYEIVNPIALFPKGYFEPSFMRERFRPLKKTNIDVFEKLLSPTGPDARRSETKKKLVPA